MARLVVRRAPRATEWAVALLFLGLPLAIETSWPHYFVYLPFAQTLVALETGFLLRNSVPTGSRSPVGWAAATLLLLSIVLASMPFFHLVGRWQDYSQYGVLFVANLSLLIAAHALTLRPAAQSGRPVPAAAPAGAVR